MRATITLGPPCAVCDYRVGDVYLTSGGYSIVRCQRCGLRFLRPQPDADTLSRLYSEEYFRSSDPAKSGYLRYVADEPNLRLTFRSRLRELPQPRPGHRLLDVGAAAGFFVDEARRAGWEAEGLEMSSWATEYARATLGVPVKNGTIATSEYPRETFDAVTLWEVIEHVSDPMTALKELRRLIKPGGTLALSTPDAGSLVARACGKRWLGWRKIPEHLFYFDLKTLSQCLVAAGFRTVRHRYVSIDVSADFALRRLGEQLGVRLPCLPRRVGCMSVSINPYYDLMILAQAS